MVRTRPRNVPKDREPGRRSNRASVAPTSEELQRRFRQLTLAEQRRLFDNPAPTPSAGRIPWHQAAASRSWISTTSATRSMLQVPEVSSQSMEVDVEILEEPAPSVAKAQSPQAPTLPGDITSTTEGGAELTSVTTEELMLLNNQFDAAAASMQEYISEMNALEVCLEPFKALEEARKDILASTQQVQKNLK